MNFDNHKYNKNLQPYANKLRKEMTKAEASLWKYVLKGKQLRNYQFRRQRPVVHAILEDWIEKKMGGSLKSTPN